MEDSRESLRRWGSTRTQPHRYPALRGDKTHGYITENAAKEPWTPRSKGALYFTSAVPNFIDAGRVFTDARLDFTAAGPDCTAAAPDFTAARPDFNDEEPDFTAGGPDCIVAGP